MTRRRRCTLLVASLLVLGFVGTGLAFWLQGYRVYVVHTGSMEPGYRPGDIVVDAPAAGGYRPGDVITFLHSDLASDVVTHRIVSVTPAGLIHTKGDANRTPDTWEIRPDQVQGRTVLKARGVGYLLVFLRQPAGIAALATGVLSIVLLWGLFFPGDPGDSDAADSPDRPTSPPKCSVSGGWRLLDRRALEPVTEPQRNH